MTRTPLTLEQKTARKEYHKQWRYTRAVTAGREPGKIGGHRKATVTKEAKAEQNKLRVAKWLTNNSERRKEIASKSRKMSYVRDLVASRIYGAACTRNRRARIRDIGGVHTANDIHLLMQKQKGKCAWCLMSFGTEGYHVDHKQPLALGGSNGPENLQLLHSKCNLTKSAKDPIKFAQQHGLLCW